MSTPHMPAPYEMDLALTETRIWRIGAKDLTSLTVSSAEDLHCVGLYRVKVLTRWYDYPAEVAIYRRAKEEDEDRPSYTWQRDDWEVDPDCFAIHPA